MIGLLLDTMIFVLSDIGIDVLTDVKTNMLAGLIPDLDFIDMSGF